MERVSAGGFDRQAREPGGEQRSLARNALALHLNPAAVSFEDLLADGQAEARAGGAGLAAGVASEEPAEDQRLLLGRDAQAVSATSAVTNSSP